MPRRTNTLRGHAQRAPTWDQRPDHVRAVDAELGAEPHRVVGKPEQRRRQRPAGRPAEPALVPCDAAQRVAERLGLRRPVRATPQVAVEEQDGGSAAVMWIGSVLGL
jgi:hypothetical protein